MAGESLAGPPILAEKGKAFDAGSAGGLQSLDNTGGVPGGGEGNKAVTRFGEPFQLAGKDLVGPEVVGDAGEDGTVGIQAEGREGAPVGLEASNEFGAQVLGLGGAATVATGYDFIPAKENGDKSIRHGEDGALHWLKGRKSGLSLLDGFGQHNG